MSTRGGKEEKGKQKEEKQKKIYLGERQDMVVVVTALPMQYLHDHYEIQLPE